MIIKVIALGAVLFAGIIAYACIMAAATSDEQADEMYREYLRYKKKKEEEEKWKQ